MLLLAVQSLASRLETDGRLFLKVKNHFKDLRLQMAMGELGKVRPVPIAIVNLNIYSMTPKL